MTGNFQNNILALYELLLGQTCFYACNLGVCRRNEQEGVNKKLQPP